MRWGLHLFCFIVYEKEAGQAVEMKMCPKEKKLSIESEQTRG